MINAILTDTTYQLLTGVIITLIGCVIAYLIPKIKAKYKSISPSTQILIETIIRAVYVNVKTQLKDKTVQDKANAIKGSVISKLVGHNINVSMEQLDEIIVKVLQELESKTKDEWNK